VDLVDGHALVGEVQNLVVHVGRRDRAASRVSARDKVAFACSSTSSVNFDGAFSLE
jgi:hypothetical protein